LWENLVVEKEINIMLNVEIRSKDLYSKQVFKTIAIK